METIPSKLQDIQEDAGKALRVFNPGITKENYDPKLSSAFFTYIQDIRDQADYILKIRESVDINHK
jgi:hypothetical protein